MAPIVPGPMPHTLKTSEELNRVSLNLRKYLLPGYLLSRVVLLPDNFASSLVSSAFGKCGYPTRQLSSEGS